MIDNFELITPLLTFEDDETYYHLQIVRRGKDHKELPSANRMIKAYFICKNERLTYLKDEIVHLCEVFGARAYINLAPKSLSKTTLLQMKYLSERLFNGDVKKIWKSWQTCAGLVKSRKPAWIVDIDEKPIEYANEVKDFINALQPIGDKIKVIVPTNSGFHLITKPFRCDVFQEKYPDIGVHKNNPTLLYMP